MSGIEELAKEYAEGIVDGLSFHHSSPREVGQMVEDAYMDGANTLMSFPLTDRLTAEEKEQIRFAHKAAKTFAERTNPMSAEVFKGQYLLLESIFGSDFFKEENI